MFSKLTAALLILSGFSAVARAETVVQTLMREKLESAHAVLDGLALEDYSKIEHHAELLAKLSRATTWYRQDVPEFLHFAKSFQNSTQFLLDQARAKNLEGVSMGYIRVTLDCLQCHNTVRAGRPKK